MQNNLLVFGGGLRFSLLPYDILRSYIGPMILDGDLIIGFCDDSWIIRQDGFVSHCGWVKPYAGDRATPAGSGLFWQIDPRTIVYRFARSCTRYTITFRHSHEATAGSKTYRYPVPDYRCWLLSNPRTVALMTGGRLEVVHLGGVPERWCLTRLFIAPYVFDSDVWKPLGYSRNVRSTTLHMLRGTQLVLVSWNVQCDHILIPGEAPIRAAFELRARPTFAEYSRTRRAFQVVYSWGHVEEIPCEFFAPMGKKVDGLRPARKHRHRRCFRVELFHERSS